MPRGQMRPVKKVKKGIFTRVVKYMFQDYMPQMILVVACIFISVFCTLQGTLFQKTLIDSYILPMLKSGSTDFTPLASAILKLIGILSVGILASFLYNRIMVTVSQGTMEKMREEIFSHMETLPIRYFDTHSHGDIMSVYTNDVDTMRQVISQTIPNVISSSITIISSFVSMILLSIPLTLVSLMMIGLMMIVVVKIGGKSSKYFMEQQKSLGQLNGYVEEMIQGVKVVKVFCHEKESVEGFEKNNEQLRVSANNANKFANIMMPIMGNLGNISYVLIAVVGAGLSLSGLTGLTLGTLVSFLTLNKNFTMPVTQISQQVNAVAAAMAGAERIFDLLDEKSEDDDGYVTLVNAVEDADGTLHEADHRTGVWAWKHPHKADGLFRVGAVLVEEVDVVPPVPLSSNGRRTDAGGGFFEFHIGHPGQMHGLLGHPVGAEQVDRHQENGKQDTDRLGIHDRSRLSYAKIIKKAALKVKAFSRSGTYRSFQKKRQKRDIRVISHAAFQGLFPPAGRHMRQMLLDDFPHHDADK